MNPSKRLGYLAALLAMLVAGGVLAQSQQPQQKAGPQQKALPELVVERDYTRVNPPQPVSSGKKIEVIEFFWYGCPHCYHLEPSLKAWLKRKPADVDFRYVPGTFGAPQWEPLTRTYYALDALGVAGKYHDAIFTAIQQEKDLNRQRALISDPRVIADWISSQGVDKQKFLDAYNSFAVNGRTQRSVDMTRNYDVPGTPALVVDGKYLTGPSMTLNADSSVNYERFFQVLDQLIAQARKDRSSKK